MAEFRIVGGRLNSWVDARLAAGFAGEAIVGALGRLLAARSGLPIDASAPALLKEVTTVPHDDLDIDDLDPWALGAVFERSLDPDHRHALGVHYTPPAVARKLAAVAMQWSGAGARVCDPALGGGVFLLAAADELEARGVPCEEVVADRLWGIDIDVTAVRVTETALALWASRSGRWVTPGPHLTRADTLTEGPVALCGSAPSFDVVLGNPPFQGQLTSDTARSAARNAALRERWEVAAGPYADTAAFFLLAGVDMVHPGGVVCLLAPHSVLGAVDAGPVRKAVHDRAALVGMWVGDRTVFEADVRVCAPVLRRGVTQPASVQRWLGAEVEPAPAMPWPPPQGAHRWASLLAETLGAPTIRLETTGPPLSDSCTATAGFRQQFYGLAPHCEDGEPVAGRRAQLVTVGMIDPFRNRWGHGSFTFNKQRYSRPCVDLASLAAADRVLADWVSDRLEPKVLVATQTRIMEVVVDRDGEWVPSTPVIAVTPRPDRIWHVAAVLGSPVATALGFAQAAGAALSADTLRLSATQLLDLPTPTVHRSWDEAARLVRVASDAADPDEWATALAAFGEAMTAAYGLTGADASRLHAWWSERLPAWR